MRPGKVCGFGTEKTWILAGCLKLEDILKTEKIDVPDERIYRLSDLKRGITEAKQELKELQYTQAETEAKLASLQKQAASLRKELKPPEFRPPFDR